MNAYKVIKLDQYKNLILTAVMVFNYFNNKSNIFIEGI